MGVTFKVLSKTSNSVVGALSPKEVEAGQKRSVQLTFMAGFQGKAAFRTTCGKEAPKGGGIVGPAFRDLGATMNVNLTRGLYKLCVRQSGRTDSVEQSGLSLRVTDSSPAAIQPSRIALNLPVDPAKPDGPTAFQQQTGKTEISMTFDANTKYQFRLDPPLQDGDRMHVAPDCRAGNITAFKGFFDCSTGKNESDVEKCVDGVSIDTNTTSNITTLWVGTSGDYSLCYRAKGKRDSVAQSAIRAIAVTGTPRAAIIGLRPQRLKAAASTDVTLMGRRRDGKLQGSSLDRVRLVPAGTPCNSAAAETVAAVALTTGQNVMLAVPPLPAGASSKAYVLCFLDKSTGLDEKTGVGGFSDWAPQQA